MRALSALALASILGGVALLAYGAATGQAQVHLVVIFPVFTGSGLTPFAGMLLIALGMFLGFVSFAGLPLRMPVAPREEQGATPPSVAAPAPARKFGGVVFVGPFPIVFGSDATVSKYMLLLAIAMTILLFILFLFVIRGATAP